jgi:hypothetical protein
VDDGTTFNATKNGVENQKNSAENRSYEQMKIFNFE